MNPKCCLTSVFCKIDGTFLQPYIYRKLSSTPPPGGCRRQRQIRGASGGGETRVWGYKVYSLLILRKVSIAGFYKSAAGV